jgi:ribosomal protein S18 acetylase RimI-like enzyme
MTTNRLLEPDDLSSLYNCFLEAFSDYQVPMQVSREQFAQRLARDGVQLQLSAAAFDNERMLGFYINGLGEWQGELTAYDAGTGVIPQYRKRGIAKDLFSFLLPRLNERSVSRYLLEVFTSNEPAVSLYRKLGFVETRCLAAFRASEPVKSVAPETSIRRLERADWPLFRSFWDGYPSWQNSSAAVERSADQRTIVGAFEGESCIGYGVVFRPAATLMQLAVAPSHRRKGIGTAIMVMLQNEVAEPLQVNNIDEELKGTCGFYEALGFKVLLRQFEMVKTL